MGSRDMKPDDTVACPVCHVEYAAAPYRCESCGYRFKPIPTTKCGP